MVELVNNHVLFPEPADWSGPPKWWRRWQNAIAPALTGAESRLGVRVQPRVGITYDITAPHIPALAKLDDRIRAAKKSGLACAPYHGRGFVLQETVSADVVTLDRDWSASFAPYLLLITASDLYEVREIIGVDGDVLLLDDEVARSYYAGSYCWPLIFGKFTCGDLPARTPGIATISITIEELSSPASVQLGEVEAPVGTGIGNNWAIGSTFEV